MTIEIQEISDEQKIEMKRIADITQMLINLILEYEPNFDQTQALAGAKSAMMFAHSMILSGIKKIQMAKEVESLPNPQRPANQTIN